MIPKFIPVAAVFLGLFAVSAAARAGSDAVPDVPENKLWFVAEGGAEAVWLGESGQACTIVLRKSQVIPGVMRIESDVTAVEFASRRQATEGSDFYQLRVPIRPNMSNEVKLELQSGRPVLRVGDAEIPSLRAMWIQVVTSPDELIRVSLPDASHATIKLQLSGKDVPAAAAAPEVVTTRPATPREIDGTELPVLSVKRTGTAQELLAAAKALAGAIQSPCRPCGGDGKTTKEVRTGTRNEGMYQRPIMETRTVTCETCKGSGSTRGKDEAVLRIANNTIQAIARLNLESRQAPDALAATYTLLVERVIGDRAAWQLLNRNGRGVAAQQKVTPDLGVILRVVDAQRLQSGDAVSEWFIARISGTNEWILLNDPVSAEVATRGAPSLAGGLTAGDVKLKDGRRFVVLQHGFLITPQVHRDFIWWWAE